MRFQAIDEHPFTFTKGFFILDNLILATITSKNFVLKSKY